MLRLSTLRNQNNIQSDEIIQSRMETTVNI